VSSNFFRIFGNAEWRQQPDLVWNVGALIENSDIAGSSISPRVMLNWHVDEYQTLRIGTSTAFRPPSAFEKYGVVRYYDTNGNNPITTVENHGNASSEQLVSQELGYFFRFPAHDVVGDVRLFQESVRQGLAHTGSVVGQEYFNGDAFRINGLEYQIGWKPRSGTTVGLSQSYIHISADSLIDPTTQFRVEHGAPRLTTSFSLTHALPAKFTVALQHQQIEDTALMSDSNHHNLFSMHRTDLRLAKQMQWSNKNAEVAFTLQNADVPIQDGDHKFWFDRRAFVTLRIEN
jgi:iron complex outermembrane receptor protein